MKSEEILIGNEYQCKSKLLKEDFVGSVLSKLDNSCIVEIIQHNPIDEVVSRELQHKVVVSYKDMKKLKNDKAIAN